MALASSLVHAEADARAAPWPLESRLFAKDQGQFWGFGCDVALDGETALVGADAADVGQEGAEGAAYFFGRQSGEWVEQDQLVASDGGSGDRFGASVTLQAGVAAVGAYLADPRGEIHEGAVYVYEEVDGEWVQTPRLTASDGDAQDRMGFSLALDGDLLAVGAIGEEGGFVEGCEETGAVYVFTRVGRSWEETAKLFDPDGACSALFGFSLDLDGDTLVVGAANETSTGHIGRTGAAYVYRWTGSAWDLEDRLEPSGDDPNLFGWSVAAEGDTLLVGAPQEHVDGTLRQGAVYVFERVGSNWFETQRLLASAAQEDGQFGLAVDLAGSLATVGGQADQPNGQPEQGVVYELRREGGLWGEVDSFTAPQGQGFDRFGAQLELTSERLIVANVANLVVSPSGGAAWIFSRPVLHQDGFESGNANAWDQVVGAPSSSGAWDAPDGRNPDF